MKNKFLSLLMAAIMVFTPVASTVHANAATGDKVYNHTMVLDFYESKYKEFWVGKDEYLQVFAVNRADPDIKKIVAYLIDVDTGDLLDSDDNQVGSDLNECTPSADGKGRYMRLEIKNFSQEQVVMSITTLIKKK